MKSSKKWKIAGAVMGLVFLSAACVSVAASYQEKAFDPGAFTGRDRKENQILFPGQDVSLGQDEQQSDSELWQQNEDAEENKKPEDKPSSSVLFQTMKVADNTANSETVPQEEQSQPQNEVIYKQGGSDDPKTPSSYKKPDGNADSDKPQAEPSKRPSDNGGGSDNKPGDNGGGKDNKPGNSNEPSPDTQDTPVTPSPSPTSQPAQTEDNAGQNTDHKSDHKSDTEDKKDEENKEEPQEPAQKDLDSTVPTLPKKDYFDDMVDPYPGSDKIDIKDEEDYKRYSLMVTDLLSMDDEINSLYMGEYLNDQRVLCAMMVYVCEDGTPKYRLTELDDNFKIGSYPEQITEDTVTFTFYFRPNDKYDWISCSYDVDIRYSAKLLLMDQKNETVLKQVVVPKTNPEVELLKYYYEATQNEDPELGSGDTDSVRKLFLGWSETEGGESVGNFYDVKKTGAQILYPVSQESLPAGMEAEWRTVFFEQNGISDFTLAQVLTKAEVEDGTLTVPDGIQMLDLDFSFDEETFWPIYTTCDTIKIPDSVLYLSTDTSENQEDFFSFHVNNAYEVAENNRSYAAEDGILMNREKTQILAIPLSREKVTVPDHIENVHFAMDNQISEIHFTAEKPADVSFAWLSNAKIYVPTSSYLRYLSAWGKNPGGTNELLAEGASVDDFTEDDTAIYSADGKTLLSVKSSVKGVYVVKEGVEKIAASAFENCGTINILLLPESLQELESKSLLDNAPQKILFLGMTPPSVKDDSFAETSVLQVETAAKDAYEAAFTDHLSVADQMINRVFSYVKTEDGYQYLDEEEDEVYPASALLLGAPEDLTCFTEASLPGVSLTEIGPHAFSACQSLRFAELPAGLTRIDTNAFAGCSSLEGVISYEPDQMEIGDDAFADTSALRFVALNAMYLESYDYFGTASWYAPATGTGYLNINRYSPDYYLQDIAGGKILYGTATDADNNPTEDCYLLSATTDIAGTVTLAENTYEILDYAFMNCVNTFTIENLEYVSYVDNYAFCGSGISGEIKLGSDLRYLGAGAFQSCDGITGLTLDGSSLDTSVYQMPFGSSVFSFCSNLASVNIVGKGSYDIGNEAFYGCMSLQEVSIAETAGIHSVGYAAFGGTDLVTLELPESVNDIGYGVFSQCGRFEKLILHSVQPPMLFGYDPHSAFEFSESLAEDFIEIPEGAEQDYIDAWKYYLLGYMPEEEDALTKEELFESANKVRAILGLPLEEEKEEEDPSVSGNDVDADAAAVTVSENAAE